MWISSWASRPKRRQTEMKNIDVQYLIHTAGNLGRKVSDFEARTYLGAKVLLLKDPSNEVAQKVVEEFSRFLVDGEWPMHQGGRSFAPFVLPHFETAEELQAHR